MATTKENAGEVRAGWVTKPGDTDADFTGGMYQRSGGEWVHVVARADMGPTNPNHWWTVKGQTTGDVWTVPSSILSQVIAVRYVVTYRAGKLRTISAPAWQGRYTFATPDDAAKSLAAMLENTSADTLRQVHGPDSAGTYEVSPVLCWPGHFDPQRCHGWEVA